jgi:pteridine reductase
VDLQGATILVTGSARRLGRSIALELGAAGAQLVIHHHASEAEAASTCAELHRLGVGAHPVQADLSSSQGIRLLFEGVDRLGGLHGLVNSAAIMVAGDLLSVTESDWDHTLNLNLKAAYFVLQQAALRMRRAGGGVIVNIADIAGLRPWPRFPVHSISKAGILALTQVAALVLAPEIRVNAVVPGPVLKPEAMQAERWETLGRSLPLRRTGSPEDVARAVRFLMENDFITGEALLVDGGNQFAPA